MVWTAALALLAANPFSIYVEAAKVIPNDAAWRFITEGKSFYWVEPKDVDASDLVFGNVTVWMHGAHRLDKDVPYRTSVWRVKLDCRGSLTYLASTTYKADGNQAGSWDGPSRFEYIRPNTMQADLEKVICKK